MQATSFIDFIRKDRRNRIYGWSALGISVVLLVLFKTLYPYPNMVLDSYYYVSAAAGNWDTNAWPIGYSRFLQLFHWFSHSPLALVCVQYLFLQVCNLTLFFTLLYFYRPGKAAAAMLHLFLFLNPLFLYLSNLVMADALFTGLSVLWVVQLLWIVFRPRPYMIVTHAVLLLVTFTIRYNALYYPLVATLAFIVSRQSWRWKLAGIGLQVVLLGSFIFYTSGKVAALTGERQFSPFGGWKIANDALFMYAHIPPAERGVVPVRFQPLDTLVRKFFDKTHDDGNLDRKDQFWGSNYMFEGYSPLVRYMVIQHRQDTGFINSKRWASMGTLYGAYGAYLIRKYPISYAQYFLWPNTVRYIFPTLEIFESFSPFYLRDDELGVPAREWFGLTTLTPRASSINLRTNVFALYPVLFILVQLGFIMGGLGFVFLKGLKSVSKPYLYSLLLIAGLWIFNFFFSVTAAAIVFRYLIFILIISFAYALLLFDFTYGNRGKQTTH